MKKFFFIGIICALTILSFSASNAQNVYDALRLSTPGLTLGARSLGMGTVFTGSANDFSAIYTNPAGLGQIRMNEFSLGLSNFSYNDAATFFNTPTSFSNSTTSLNNLSLVYPFPTVRGSMVVAGGYNRDAEFSSAVSFKGFNPYSSKIGALSSAYGTPFHGNFLSAWSLYLADSSLYRNTSLHTPILDSLQQQGKTIESGGLSNWTIAGAVEAARNLYLGVSVTIVAGSYDYLSDFTESDVYNKYSVARYDSDWAFNTFSSHETIKDDIGGLTAKIGLIYRPDLKTRIGLSVKLPTYYHITETYSLTGSSMFDVPFPFSGYQQSFSDNPDPSSTDYDVHSPWVLNAGGSYAFGDLLLAGDLDYTDWSQMEYSNAAAEVEALNTDIKENFQSALNLRAGAEYEIPATGIRLRGGYAYFPSPLKADNSSNARKYITAGIGFIIDNSVSLDLGYAHGTWNTDHANYSNWDQASSSLVPDAYSVTSEKVTTHQIMGTFSYRF